MKRSIFIRLPQPLVFVISLLLLVLTVLAIINYIEKNPLPVFGDSRNVNVTFEDLAEKIYENLND